jgi:hypothetical protein
MDYEGFSVLALSSGGGGGDGGGGTPVTITAGIGLQSQPPIITTSGVISLAPATLQYSKICTDALDRTTRTHCYSAIERGQYRQFTNSPSIPCHKNSTYTLD